MGWAEALLAAGSIGSMRGQPPKWGFSPSPARGRGSGRGKLKTGERRLEYRARTPISVAELFGTSLHLGTKTVACPLFSRTNCRTELPGDSGLFPSPGTLQIRGYAAPVIEAWSRDWLPTDYPPHNSKPTQVSVWPKIPPRLPTIVRKNGLQAIAAESERCAHPPLAAAGGSSERVSGNIGDVPPFQLQRYSGTSLHLGNKTVVCPKWG